VGGGGAHQFYTGTTRDADSSALPQIANGMDIRAIAEVMMPRMSAILGLPLAGEPAKDLDEDELNTELGRLPDTPDENLR
jgi:hypothetical protein